jgi:DNA-directed RNA polymerase sigma subunit (sigma70/sigma32)
LENIGRELGITRERVRQLEREALAKLEAELTLTLSGDVDPDSDELARSA